MTASERIDAEIDAQAGVNRPYTDFPEIEWAHVKPHDAPTVKLREEPHAPTLKNARQQRRNPVDWLEHQLVTVACIAVGVTAALTSAVGIVLAGFVFMIVVGGGLHIVTATLNALPWELLALAVILALLWRAQGHNDRR